MGRFKEGGGCARSVHIFALRTTPSSLSSLSSLSLLQYIQCLIIILCAVFLNSSLVRYIFSRICSCKSSRIASLTSNKPALQTSYYGLEGRCLRYVAHHHNRVYYPRRRHRRYRFAYCRPPIQLHYLYHRRLTHHNHFHLSYKFSVSAPSSQNLPTRPHASSAH